MAVKGQQTADAIAGAASEAINAFGDLVTYKKFDYVASSSAGAIDTLYDEVGSVETPDPVYIDTTFNGRITFNPNEDKLTEIGLAQDETSIVVFTTQDILDTAVIVVDTKDRLEYDGKVYNITQAKRGGQYASAFITVHIAGQEVDTLS